MTPIEVAGIMFPLFIVLVILRIPVAIALGLACVPIFLIEDRLTPFLLMNEMFKSYNSFVLLAVPFFLLAANIMNAAGITDRGDIVNTSEELFDKMIGVNVKGPYFLIQDTVKIMLEKKIHGSIINIGAVAAMTGQPFISTYCLSKGALATLTRNTAFALLKNRIRVNQLNIGWMASDGEHEIQTKYHGASEDWLKDAAKEQPFGRLLDPKEVAKAVTFLASEDSGMMTGSVVNFDQSVWGGYPFAPPQPAEEMKLK